MDRLEELKEKGWLKLNAVERAEYKELNSSNAKHASKTDSDEMKISKVELDKMINEAATSAIERLRTENEKLRQEVNEKRINEWQNVGPDKKRNQTATLKLYQADARSPLGVIVKADYFKTVWNEEEHKFNKTLYTVKVLYEDKEEELEMDVRDYIKLNRVEKVEILEVDREKQRLVSGVVQIPTRNKEGYPVRRANDQYGAVENSAGEVELDVVRYKEIFKVKRPSGQVFQIESQYLNN